jgi:hypothetical protein
MSIPDRTACLYPCSFMYHSVSVCFVHDILKLMSSTRARLSFCICLTLYRHPAGSYKTDCDLRVHLFACAVRHVWHETKPLAAASHSNLRSKIWHWQTLNFLWLSYQNVVGIFSWQSAVSTQEGRHGTLKYTPNTYDGRTGSPHKAFPFTT